MKIGPQTANSKSLLVRLLQWLYLSLGIVALGLPLIYKNTVSASLDLPNWLVWGATAAVVLYCLLLFVSFLTQNNFLVIISLVFIFLSTILGIVLLGAAVPNLQNLISGGIPACWHNLSECSLKNGIIVASAASLAAAVPLLVLNIITIVGSVKAIGASD